ncbi:MAG TPA: hypothetical protein ENI62_02785 [Gammaproteobacteria bacterium]|nr:hypothetical protein [Gammaproteobacteria bacterium]
MPAPTLITPALFVALWLRTVKNSTKDQAQQVFRQLDQHYNNAQRHYHNWSHIAQCLGFIEEMAEQLEAADRVRLAIWFHDVICTPGQSDNEHRSVNFFRHCVADPVTNSTLCDHIERLIMATCHCGDLTSVDLAAMADADLGSFCLPWDQFHRDSLHVVEEYGDSDRAEKKAGKAAFLQNLLERPSIYHSVHFLKFYESRARDNIQRELALMQEQ